MQLARVSQISPPSSSQPALAFLDPEAPTKALLPTRGVEEESGEGWECVWAVLAANHMLELLDCQKAKVQLKRAEAAARSPQLQGTRDWVASSAWWVCPVDFCDHFCQLGRVEHQLASG